MKYLKLFEKFNNENKVNVLGGIIIPSGGFMSNPASNGRTLVFYKKDNIVKSVVLPSNAKLDPTETENIKKIRSLINGENLEPIIEYGFKYDQSNYPTLEDRLENNYPFLFQ